MSCNFAIAGGSTGIGEKLVEILSKSAERIEVFSRHVGDLAVNGPVNHNFCDFIKDNIRFDDLPDKIHGVEYCPGSINLRSLQACLPGLKNGAVDQPTGVVLFCTVAVRKGIPMHTSVAAAKGPSKE